MNEPLFEKIIKSIEEEPRRMDMGTWLDTHDREAPCKTAGCIAGHAVAIDYQERMARDDTRKRRSKPRFQDAAKWIMENYQRDTGKQACELLQITNAESQVLFYVEQWPLYFQRKYVKTRARTTAAKVVIARLRYFMKNRR